MKLTFNVSEHSFSSKIPSLSSSKSQPSGIESPSESTESSKPSQISLSFKTPSPSVSQPLTAAFWELTSFCPPEAALGTPFASSVSLMDPSGLRSAVTNPPFPSTASKQPSPSASVSNWFINPSPSISNWSLIPSPFASTNPE